MVRRTIGFSDYWSFGPMVHRNIGMSPQETAAVFSFDFTFTDACPDPPVLPHTTVTTAGTALRLRCNIGHVFPDGTTETWLTCSSQGLWQPVVEGCQCKIQYNIINIGLQSWPIYLGQLAGYFTVHNL